MKLGMHTDLFPRHIGDSLDQASITADPRRSPEPIKHLGVVSATPFGWNDFVRYMVVLYLYII